jgi:hypothetical protein
MVVLGEPDISPQTIFGIQFDHWRNGHLGFAKMTRSLFHLCKANKQATVASFRDVHEQI